MKNKTVRIINEPEIIKILADPVRREIIRILQYKPQTQTQLAKKLNISKPSINHHIELLKQFNLIKIAYLKLESHGISQKYFEPTSDLFIEDFLKTPANIQKYFLQFHIERLRGMLSVFQLIREQPKEPILISPKELKNLAYEIAKMLSTIGKKYEKIKFNFERESLLISIYYEALNIVMNKSSWKPFFDNFFQIDRKVIKASKDRIRI
jgi:predicted transcriptional regulator